MRKNGKERQAIEPSGPAAAFDKVVAKVMEEMHA
jgi:hypothetical protein